jgi:hypothetical protein
VALQARKQVVKHFSHKHHELVEAQAVDDEPVAAAQRRRLYSQFVAAGVSRRAAHAAALQPRAP